MSGTCGKKVTRMAFLAGTSVTCALVVFLFDHDQGSQGGAQAHATVPTTSSAVGTMPSGVIPPTTTTSTSALVPPTAAAVQQSSKCHPWPSKQLPAGCPNEDDYVAEWAQRLVEAGRKPRKWTIVDVGANKGYALAAVLEGLGIAKAHGLTRKDAYAYRLGKFDGTGGFPESDNRGHGPFQRIGGCRDGDAAVSEEGVARRAGAVAPQGSDGGAPGGWRAILVEGQSHLVEGLRWLYQRRPNVAASGGNVTIVHGGASDHIGNISFEQCGHEACGISPNGQSTATSTVVPLVTLDSIVPPEVDYIDVLMTDTEGHDYFVADGAARFFGAPSAATGVEPEVGGFTAKVGLYIFEIHGLDRPLDRQVQMLHRRGMDCFFPPPMQFQIKEFAESAPNQTKDVPKYNEWRQMYRVSGQCWRRDTYPDNLFGFGNVVCVNRVKEPELLAAFDSMLEKMRITKAYI